MLLQKFTMRDIVFIAILSAKLLLVSALIMPIVMFTQIFALRQLLAAPIFAIFSVIACKKVRKIGTLSLIGFLTGGVLVFMSPIMFFTNFFGALLTEIIILLIFRNYKTNKSIISAATLYMPLSLPFTLLSNMMIKGLEIKEQFSSTFEITLIPIFSLIIAFIGAMLGMKISNEMQKAGKL